jgi:hypothetical protein
VGTHQTIEYGNVIHEIFLFQNDVDLAITKSIENGLITFGQKEIVLKRFKKL